MFRLSKSQPRHSFLLHSIFNMSNMTGATSGGGTSCLMTGATSGGGTSCLMTGATSGGGTSCLMTGATSGGGTSCLSGAMCLPQVFGECRVAQCSVCLLCSVLWTIIIPFIARPVYCLSFGLHLHTHPY